MRRLLAALVLALLIPSQVLAASGPPPGLAGTLAIVAQDVTSVTLHAEQTGGDPVTLTVEHYCYENANQPNEVYGGMEKVRFVGSVSATFHTGPRTYHGKLVTPTDCWAFLMFYYSSSRAVMLDFKVTLP